MAPSRASAAAIPRPIPSIGAELVELALPRLYEMSRHGTTTVEIGSFDASEAVESEDGQVFLSAAAALADDALARAYLGSAA